ncbi:hypothetical protein [Priestia megaterium]|uniref:hypothetical protein n=1 Tax=Priestia megaterium TaxID=1404 RepID=UPI0011A8A34D|nr:hypothetical protein [Priestia megaterium]
MKSPLLGLVIDSSLCQLPEKETDFFYFEGAEGLNIEEGVTRLPYRIFFPSHIQSKDFINKLGAENTFIFLRVLFSYFDAWYMLYDFTQRYSRELSAISLTDIEEKAKHYDIDSFNYLSVDREMFLSLYDIKRDNHVERYHFFHNEFQELFWTMNLEKILSNHGISYYPDRTFSDKEKNVGNTSLVVYKMLKISEVGMVMHTWRKLNSYNRSDFINNVSNILEFIKKDLETNKNSFSTHLKDFPILEQLINMVCFSKRPLYFGLFNSADLFGFLSRHGSQKLVNYQKLSGNTELKMKTIKKNMTQGIIPNQDEVRYMFNVWHYTTSLIVTLWFRLKTTK